MKKTILLIFVLSLHCVTASAADFQPVVMKITVPEVIQYDFDGSYLEIDFNITGPGGAFWLVINTVGQAENIGLIQNGYLGWHTVNHIDTTVYVSSVYHRNPGEVTITWNGTDENGNPVEPGTYKYAIWGYDDINPRTPACMYMFAGSTWRARDHYVWTHYDNGLPRDNPVMSCAVRLPQSKEEGPYRHGMQHKWVLGGDPYDAANLQTTFCDIYPTWAYTGEQNTLGLVGCRTYTNAVFVPGTDLKNFVQCCYNMESPSSTLLMWNFVNDGNAILNENWGGWDNITWEEQLPLGRSSVPPGCYTDGDYIWVTSSDQTGVGAKHWTWLRCVDWDGEEVFNKDMQEFFMPDDVNGNDSQNCALLDIAFGINKGDMLLGTMGCCYHEFINGNVLLEDSNADKEEYLMWSNGNGDFYLDVYYQAEAAFPWSCLDNTGLTTGIHRVDDSYIDSEGFTIQYTTYIGVNSFGVQTQDGTALGYMPFGDDSVDGAAQKGGGKIIDYDSSFDGMYLPPALYLNDQNKPIGGAFVAETYFVAFDSESGIITNEVAVDEDEQAAFGVDQNSPNPFNPSTTIGFTLPESGNVSVDVFNVAGQKVDTLIDDIMSAGHHSVVWNASGYSNGVYFYTVKSGKFSETMKMTLLK